MRAAGQIYIFNVRKIAERRSVPRWDGYMYAPSVH